MRWSELDSLKWRSKSGSGPHATIQIGDATDGGDTLTGAEYEQRLAQACGPFPRGIVAVLAEFTYSWRDGDRLTQQRLHVFTEVVLFARNLTGRPLPPSGTYAAKLEVEAQNYTRRIPLSHSLEPSEADRFLITLGVDRSSFHRLELSFPLSSGDTLRSGDISIEAVVPRSWLEFVGERGP